jgi:succinyl-diaminopimelate desuccinylase
MSHANAEAWKKKVWDDIGRRREELLNLLGEVIRRPSDNPPGDTTELANFVKQVLEDSGIPVQVYEPKQANPNIVASIAQNGGRHLVLNGHLDQFPVERPDTWTDNPYSGKVHDGRIFGRGAADMKGGTTALLAASLVLKQLEVPLAGKLTLTLVSDEETGGRWGTEWLLENQPHLVGDAVLNAEPSSTEAIYVAEKGVCWLKVRTHSQGGHSGLSPLNNAIFKMSTAIQLGLKLRGKKGDVPHGLTGVLSKSRELLESLPSGKGNGWVYDSVTLNVGTIKGGVKANVVPAECEAEFDFRLPLGITPEDLIGEFRELLTKEGLGEEDITIEPLYTCPPSHTSPDAEIIRTVMQNAQAVTGKPPRLHFMYGGSDCRFWRYKGIPAAIFGPKSYNMAASDEHIEVEDYFTVMKVHAGSIIDFLGVTR